MEGVTTNRSGRHGLEMLPSAEAPYKVLEGPCKGQEPNSTAQNNSSGESEGGAVIPEESEVLAFGNGWPGDLARAIPARMPEGYVLSWLAWRLGESAPPFPRDWQADLSRRFTADWVKKTRGTRHEAPAALPTANQADVVSELAKTKDPQRRKALLQTLKGAVA